MPIFDRSGDNPPERVIMGSRLIKEVSENSGLRPHTVSLAGVSDHLDLVLYGWRWRMFLHCEGHDLVQTRNV